MQANALKHKKHVPFSSVWVWTRVERTMHSNGSSEVAVAAPVIKHTTQQDSLLTWKQQSRSWTDAARWNLFFSPAQNCTCTCNYCLLMRYLENVREQTQACTANSSARQMLQKGLLHCTCLSAALEVSCSGGTSSGAMQHSETNSSNYLDGSLSA